MRRGAAMACAALALGGCATAPRLDPLHAYTSWDDTPGLQVLADAVDARMRQAPGFVRDFEPGMHSYISSGGPTADGRPRVHVRFELDGRLEGRRIAARDRVLAEFELSCAPGEASPCAEEIVARERAQPARIRRILARSPRDRKDKA